MHSLRLSTKFEPSWDLQASLIPCGPSNESRCMFKTIPPERVGLNGEYDHSGLAKRVSAAFRKQFSPPALENLRITQRGRVVVLSGRIPNQQVLTQMVDAALEIMGTFDVETYGIKMG
jgi:hypothetical protein